MSPSPHSTRSLPLLFALLAASAAAGCGVDRSGAADGGDDGPLPACANHVRDLTETDIDCGGSCGPCDDGARCLADGDCQSGRCLAHNCALDFHVDAPRAYSAGIFPTGVAAGEVHGDGKIDLLVSLRNEWSFAAPESHLALLTGNGDGTFQDPVTFITPGFPGTIAAADLDGDGLTDVALPDQETDQIAVLLADGAGGFRHSFNVTGASSASDLRTGDFDGDGKIDLLVVARTLIFLPGDGTGHFASPVSLPLGSAPLGVAVADWNGDHRSDVMLSAGFGGTQLLLGKSGFRFAPPAAAAPLDASALLAGDFDKDGQLDAAGIDADSGGLKVLLGRGDGTFRAALALTNPVPFNALLAAADFDGDGDLDVAAAGANGTLQLLPGSGDGGFEKPVPWDVGTSPSGLVAADLDGDGHPDIATANAETDDVTVLLNKGDGTFPRATLLPDVQSPLSLLAADLDGDGRDDLITGGNYSGVSVRIANGDGSFRPSVDTWVGGLPSSLAVADFDGDGHLEIVAASRTSGQTVLLRQEGGTWTLQRAVDQSGDPTGLATGDLDGDGHPDLAIVDQRANVVHLLIASGPGFSHLDPLKAGTGAFAPALCDLDHDGRLDVVIAIAGSARKGVGVLLARGAANHFDPVTTYPFGSFDAEANAAAVICRDLDGRPGAEVALIDANSPREKTVSILTADADGALHATGSVFGGAGLASLSIAPLHRGGRLHALVASPRGVGFLLGSGSGGFEPAVTWRLSGASYGATFGDFDGDGRTDIAAIVEGFPSRVTVLRNHP